MCGGFANSKCTGDSTDFVEGYKHHIEEDGEDYDEDEAEELGIKAATAASKGKSRKLVDEKRKDKEESYLLKKVESKCCLK